MGVEQTVCLVTVGGILEVLFVDCGNLFVVGCGAQFEACEITCAQAAESCGMTMSNFRYHAGKQA